MSGTDPIPLPNAPSAPPTGMPPSSPWAGFWRRGLRNQLVCAVIGLLVWSLSTGTRGTLFTAWVYSTAIGTCCWFFIDGGRLLISDWLPAGDGIPSRGGKRWPGPGWMLFCILVGTALGYSLGTALGDRVTGFNTPSLWHNRAAIALSLVVAVAATWYFYATERLRIEQAATEAARREAAESQLMLLQSQLEPHMLFNTLANLRVLINLDPQRAQAMLDHLIRYLRATLGASHATLHPLAVEFARLDDYLALMALRMGPRLQADLRLPEALATLAVPPLLLQPLVENSIRHGLEPKVAGGRIDVRAALQGDHLLLTVRDTGVGLAPGVVPGIAPGHPSGTSQAGTGYGTRHVAQRLATQYGAAASFKLQPADDAEGGTLAVLRLPLQNPTAAG